MSSPACSCFTAGCQVLNTGSCSSFFGRKLCPCFCIQTNSRRRIFASVLHMAVASTKMQLKKIWQAGKAFLFEYATPRVVTMRSVRIGLTYRLAQLLLVVYLVGYLFLYTKSYQRFDTPESSVVTRVKGTLLRHLPDYTVEHWDSTDFVVPAQETNAFFIATNLLVTRNQVQGTCPEDINVGNKTGIRCENDIDCLPVYAPTPYGNGIRTGNCVQRTGTCEIYSWCPAEADVAPEQPVLHGYDSVTLLIMNNVYFRKFGVKRRNILPSFSEEYLKTCRYDGELDPLCPVFTLRHIIKLAKSDLDSMAVKGGIISINIAWNCDLDYGEDNCLPTYAFSRLDDPAEKVGRGWNFRKPFYHSDEKGELGQRDLIKFWGIRFVYLVGGQAGQIDFVFIILHIGSSIGLFGLATLLCECLLDCGYKSELLTDSKSIDLESIKTRRKSFMATSSQLPLMGELNHRYRRHSDVASGQVTPRLASNAMVTPPQNYKELIDLPRLERFADDDSAPCDLQKDNPYPSQWV